MTKDGWSMGMQFWAMRPAILLAALTGGLAVNPAQAQPDKPDFFGGLRAYDARQIDEAVEEWTAAARAGDLRSQKQLGDLYKEGRRVSQNFATAYYWYALAAANPGDAGGAADRTVSGAVLPAMSAVKTDAASEAQKLRDALTLGDMLTAHTAVEDSYGSRGASGVFQLAEAYKNGRGLPANKVEALRFYVVASFMGSEDAVKARDALTSTLQPVQVASAQRAAAEWLKARGVKPALPPPARVAAIPVPPPPEPKAPSIPAAPPPPKPEAAPAKPPVAAAPPAREAETPPGVKPFKPPPGREAPVPPGVLKDMAATDTDAPTVAFLTPRRTTSVDLADGSYETKVVQQALKALRLYEGRPDGDYDRKTRMSIRAYQRSIDNRPTGVLSARQFDRLLTRASDTANDRFTQYHYARFLLAGRFVDRNVERAIRLMDRSADQGISDAAFLLGVMYRDGVSVPKDAAAAANRFREAEKLGHPRAEEALRRMRGSS